MSKDMMAHFHDTHKKSGPAKHSTPATKHPAPPKHVHKPPPQVIATGGVPPMAPGSAPPGGVKMMPMTVPAMPAMPGYIPKAKK